MAPKTVSKASTTRTHDVAPAKETLYATASTTQPRNYHKLVAIVSAVVIGVFAIPFTRNAFFTLASTSWTATAVLGFIVVATVATCGILLRTEEWRGGGVAGIFNHADYDKQSGVNNAIDSFLGNFSTSSRSGDGTHDSKMKERQKNYMNMVNHFYDLVTDFYEYGWGDSFHFGFRFAGEGFQESIRRTEYYLALRLGLNHTTSAVDIGCGVGGPMRNIARFSGSKITGINNNAYQIKVGTKTNIRWKLDQQCNFLQSDFMNINAPNESFDHAYAIEATCHAPDKVGCYREAYRLIKPGGYFAAYEWCVTEKYDANNPLHVSIREGIEVGNSLPVLATYKEVTDALEKAGFEVLESFNAQQDAHAGPTHVPWYQSLAGEYTLTGFRMTPVGRFITHQFVTLLEAVKIAPRGSTKVSKLLNDTAIDLVNGGKHEIFTPSFFFLARKPLK